MNLEILEANTMRQNTLPPWATLNMFEQNALIHQPVTNPSARSYALPPVSFFDHTHSTQAPAGLEHRNAPLMFAQAEPGPGQAAHDIANTAQSHAAYVNVASAGRYGNPFWNPYSTGTVGLLTGIDVTPVEIASYVRAAWERLDTLNDALSGQRPEDFRPITGPDGRPAVVARPQSRTATINFSIDRKSTPVAIDLPGFRGNAVTFATDGRRIIAVDPRNNDTWMLHRNQPRLSIPLINPTTYTWVRVDRNR